jgi:hypothetical protein
MPGALRKLRLIKLLHTVAWAFFASAILLIPVAAWLDAWRTTLALIAVVSAECVILVLNQMHCPLTPVAARYTDNRADNFDIYLPLWLARYNKQIFGTLFVVGIIFAIVRRVG